VEDFGAGGGAVHDVVNGVSGEGAGFAGHEVECSGWEQIGQNDV
jgi:hypothetical protein